MSEKSLHGICRWTFNPGKGSFVPGDMRPEWGGAFGTPEMVKLVADKVVPRMPDNVLLGIEIHYDAKVDDDNTATIADAKVDGGLRPRMLPPGARGKFCHRETGSLDQTERRNVAGSGGKGGKIVRDPESPDPDFVHKAIFGLQLGGFFVAVIGALSENLPITSAGLGAIGAGVYWAVKGRPPTPTLSP